MTVTESVMQESISTSINGLSRSSVETNAGTGVCTVPPDN